MALSLKTNYHNLWCIREIHHHVSFSGLSASTGLEQVAKVALVLVQLVQPGDVPDVTEMHTEESPQ